MKTTHAILMIHMDLDQDINYWLQSAERDWESATKMVEHNHLDWALFVGQLAIEKLIKGLIVKRTKTTPPFIHNLVSLCKTAELTTTEEQSKQLLRIAQFNIEARYTEVKHELYKEATVEFTNRWMSVMKELYLWLKNNY